VDADKGAGKLRRAAHRETGSAKDKKQRGKADAEAAEAHNELIQPDLSKGRPPAASENSGEQRPSNAGSDGP
jgi:hypothetical protein